MILFQRKNIKAATCRLVKEELALMAHGTIGRNGSLALLLVVAVSHGEREPRKWKRIIVVSQLKDCPLTINPATSTSCAIQMLTASLATGLNGAVVAHHVMDPESEIARSSSTVVVVVPSARDRCHRLHPVPRIAHAQKLIRRLQ